VQLIDTHAHLDEEAFSADQDAVIQSAKAAGVCSIFTIGISAPTSQAAVAIAEQYEHIYAVVGIQPNYVAQMQPVDFELIERLSQHPQVVGIGETGLDRYWDYAPIDLQVEYFHKHIELARKWDCPFIVHCREAEDDVVTVLRQAAEQGALKGVMHSFCGNESTLQSCLELGMHISFAGMVTFKKNDALRDVARMVPLERLLVETDAPYLAPVPQRGKRNEPAYVKHTAECLAEVHGISLEEFAHVTTDNARILFGLPT